MELDTYEFKAYCVLKKSSGLFGSCCKSNDTLCREIGCKKSKILKIKKSLVEKGLIQITKRKNLDGSDNIDMFTIKKIS